MDVKRAADALERMARIVAMLDTDVSIKAAGDEIDPTQPELREQYQKKWTALMVRTFERQRAAVMGKLPKGLRQAQPGASTALSTTRSAKELPDLAVLWDSTRWNAELSDDMFKLSVITSGAFARYVSEQIDAEFDEAQTLDYLLENSRIAAENTNDVTQGQIQEALRAEDPLAALKHVFEVALSARALEFARTRTTGLANFGTHEAARQGGLKTKTWHVNSSNPRPSHAALGGKSVGIKDLFPNGQMWPGDGRGGASENAGCTCSVTFGRGE